MKGAITVIGGYLKVNAGTYRAFSQDGRYIGEHENFISATSLVSNAMNSPAKTPMMLQYDTYKASLPASTLLAIRLGDFLEFFGPDAVRASKLLGITLTKRLEVPMAGIPFHAVDSYTTKLLAAGETVAIVNETKGSLRVLCPPTRAVKNWSEGPRSEN